MKRRLALILPASLLALLGLAATPPVAPAAIDELLTLEGVPGESRDAKVPNAIDVLAWSWGASRTGGSRTRAAGPRIQEVSITKYTDKASPVLLDRLVTGSVIPSAKLTLRKPTDPPFVFYELCMANVRVNSVNTGANGGETRMTETVALSPSAFTVRYTPQKPDGSADTKVKTGFDFSQNPVAPLLLSGCA